MEAVCRHLFLRWRGEGERERNSVSPSVRQCRQLPLSCNISFLLFAAAAAAARHLLLFLPFASPSAAHHPNSVHSNSLSLSARAPTHSQLARGTVSVSSQFHPFPSRRLRTRTCKNTSLAQIYTTQLYAFPPHKIFPGSRFCAFGEMKERTTRTPASSTRDTERRLVIFVRDRRNVKISCSLVGGNKG